MMKYYAKDYIKSKRTDSESIRECLYDATECIGRKTIIFDSKDWYIDEAIILSDDTDVIIDGCMIKQNNYVFDNVFRGNNHIVDFKNPYGSPLLVGPIRNISIKGKNNARIVGCDINMRSRHFVLNQEQDMTGDFWGWRTYQILLSRCDNFEISDLELTQTRCWAMTFELCSHGNIHDISITSSVKNGDGIDFRAGCHDCRVDNITGNTSDDTVACTALFFGHNKFPYKNYLYTLEPALSVALEKSRSLDVHDISINNVHTGGLCHGVICCAADGLKIYNIDIKNISETSAGKREATVRIYTGYGENYKDNDIHDISIENVTSEFSKYAFMCTAKVSGVTVRNIKQNNSEGDAISISYPDGINAAV
ncbi:MAG: hypothetical protein WCY62_06890 [Clostridia bacterium]